MREESDRVLRRRLALCFLIALSALLFCGCGRLQVLDEGQTPLGWFTKRTGASAELLQEEDLGPYTAPPFADSVYHPEHAVGDAEHHIDLSSLSEGYVAVSASSANRMKFQVLKDELVYNYDLASDGTVSFFPLQSGDGLYRFRIMENVVDNKYAEVCSVSSEVLLADEFQPFLRPSDYVPYTRDSLCVQKAQELAATAGDELGMVKAVFRFVCTGVSYDTVKASKLTSGYMPIPDETMQTGKGICFDYAALVGAMLRSQGIPTKEIFGYVSPGGLYHAWNMFYTAQTGWVTVSYEVRGARWNRLDLTFSANGADGTFIGDGGNYTDVYIY